MRYGIISDIHGADLRGFEEAFVALEIDFGICMSDFDRAAVAIQMRDLQRAGRIPWNVVPGNHDHSHVYGVDITSGTLDKQGIDSAMMRAEWARPDNADAKKFIQDMFENREVKKGRGMAARRIGINVEGFEKNGVDVSKGNTVVMHGAYAGRGRDEPTDLWTRLSSHTDYAKNFSVMESKGYRMMLRGHDHPPRYGYKDPDKGVVIYNGEPNSIFRLHPERMHTINPGAAHDGCFAVVDTNPPKEICPTLTYHKDARLAFNPASARIF